MADIIACDGRCGKQSPDFTKSGPHIANHWQKVSLLGRDVDRSHNQENLVFCEDCWKAVNAALHPTPSTQGGEE